MLAIACLLLAFISWEMVPAFCGLPSRRNSASRYFVCAVAVSQRTSAVLSHIVQLLGH
jgi:hypothetical protein